jgi:predicted nuclease of predicted toxin-antitoxin system
LEDLFPESEHVYAIGLAEADDRIVWEYAKDHDFTIVSKDSDYSDLSILLGSPPKAIWIRRGNCKTSEIAQILRQHDEDIQRLVKEKERNILILF